MAKRFRERGLKIIATKGTAEYLARFGFDVDRTLSKLSDNEGTSAVDLIATGEITFIVNTPTGSGGRTDGSHIRTAAVVHRVSCVTTVEAALAAAQGMAEAAATPMTVRSLQEFHQL